MPLLEFIILVSEQQGAEGRVGWMQNCKPEGSGFTCSSCGFYVPFCLFVPPGAAGVGGQKNLN